MTSSEGAALRDVLRTVLRRFPGMPVLFANTPVQGQDSARAIARAVSRLDEESSCDLILVVRGGGSMEDLAAFNDESLARAIARSKTPIITGIGHETDSTIADMVADLCASTPTAAAEHAVPVKTQIIGQLETAERHLKNAFLSQLAKKNRKLLRLEALLKDRRPSKRLRDVDVRLKVLSERQKRAFERILERLRRRHALYTQKLDDLSPLKVLGRGYALVRNEEGELLKKAESVESGSRVEIQLSEGRLEATIDAVKP